MSDTPRAPIDLRTKIFWGAGFTAIGLLLLWVLRPVFAILAAAAGIAYVLDPAVDWLEDHRFSRDTSIGILLVTGLLVFSLVLLFFVPQLLDQAETLSSQVSNFVADLDQHLAPGLAWFQETTGQEIPVDVEAFQRQAPVLIAEYWPYIQERAGAAVQGLFTQGLGIVSTLVNLALLPIFVYYLLRDWDRIIEAIDEQLPRRYQARVRRVAAEVDLRLGAFIRGQLTVSFTIGVLYSIGLLFVGIDMAVPVGLLSGALFIVPYVGNAVGFVLAAMLALIKFGFDWHVLGVAGVFIAVQIIEGYLLTPRIVGDKVGLPPLVVMVALVVGGSLLGIWGMLLAIPITAVLSVITSEWMELYRDTNLYKAMPPDEQVEEGQPAGAEG